MNRSTFGRPLDVIFSGSSKERIKGQENVLEQKPETNLYNNNNNNRIKTIQSADKTFRSFNRDSKTIKDNESVLSHTTKLSSNCDNSEKVEPSFSKVIDLITNKYSSEFVDRHLLESLKVLKSREKGLFIDEKDEVSFIVTYCLNIILDKNREDKVKERSMTVLENLILICNRPLRAKKSTDVMVKAEALTTIFQCIGKTLRLPLESAEFLKTNALKSLCDIIENREDESIILKAIKNSSIIDDLLYLLSSLVNNKVDVELEMFTEVVNALSSLSFNPLCAEKITRNGGIDLLIRVIGSAHFTQGIVFKSIEIIWNVVEMYPNASLSLGEIFSITVLFEKIQTLNKEGFRVFDKELRNDILIILAYLSREPSNHLLFKESGILEYISAVSIGLELYPEAVKLPFALTTTEYDFEMTKISWSILFYLSFNNECLKDIIELGYLSLLLDSIDPYSEVLKRWNGNHMTELQLLALKLLFILSTRVPNDFAKEQGPKLCLELAQTTKEDTLFSASLSVLMNTATTEIGCQNLNQYNTIAIMLDMCMDPSFPVSSRTDTLQIISSMCEFLGNESKEIFLNYGGVEKLLSLMRLFTNEKTVTEQDDFVFVTVHCIWSAIVGYKESETKFIENDGIYLLLNLLLKVNSVIRMAILGCIIDFMTKNQEAVEEVKIWKSKDKEPIQNILIKIWKENETNNDIIDVLEMSSIQIESSEFDLKEKVYHVLKILNFESTELPDKDRMLLTIIKSYDQEKCDKVWEEISIELEEEGIRPTTPDQELLQNKFMEKEERERNIIQGKNIITDELRKKQSEGEKSFYQTIIEHDKNLTYKKPKYNHVVRKPPRSPSDRNMSVKSFSIIGGYVNRRNIEDEVRNQPELQKNALIWSSVLGANELRSTETSTEL